LTHSRERARIRAEDTQHDLAGIEADANLDRDAVRPLHGIAVRGDPLLHPEGGTAGAHRVVLVGEGGAEQRQDPVTHHLRDSALVATHRLGHVLDHAIEEGGGFLSVMTREHGQGRGDVGEEDRDVLALARQVGA
jgi:hypothetical protein